MKHAFLALLLLSPSAAIAQQPPDPRGPVVNPGMEPKVTADGVQSSGYRFAPSKDAGPWQAPWIWLDPAAGGSESIAASFRKTVILPSAPQAVHARISADIVYRLWVNGRLVARGPADPGNDYSPRTRWSHQWLYDVRDLTPFFRQGENVIAAEVFTTEQPNYSLGRPGFAFAADFSFAAHQPLQVTTGPDWRAVPAEAYSAAEWKASAPNARPVRHIRFDAAREAPGWRVAGFVDSRWPRAVKIDSVWGSLAASEIPPRMEAVYPPLAVVRATDGVTVDGGAVTLTKDGTFAVRFDRVLSAYLSIKARGPAGTLVLLQPNEIDQPGFHRMTAAVLRAGVTYYEFPVMDSFSTVNIQVSNVTAPVTIEEVRAGFVSYPVTYAGSFETSDADLNRLWKASRWATQISMQTHHLDSPHHQEPISDPGDYLIEALENYYAFGEPWLARQDLRKFANILSHADYYNFHTSYSLLWLQMLLDYYDYTGDLALVKELAPVAHGLLDRFTGWRGKNGLISEAPNYMFMDWVNISGIPCHHPPAVIGQGYMTAFYYRGLADARRVAQLTGDAAAARRYEQLRNETAAAFQRELWNPQKGLYRDGKPFQTSVAPGQWLPADTAIETYSPHVNALAVLYDLAPAGEQKPIIGRIMAGTPLNVQPYFMHFVFAAIAHAGLFETYGVPQMRRWKLHPDSGTATEMWDSGDYSHGWTGTPLIQMSARILGVQPSTPGFRSVAIRPTPAGLDWARGVVPTPLGSLEVSWQRTSAGFRLHVSVPKQVTADVYLPLTGPIQVDGQNVTPATDGVVRVSAGTHDLFRRAN
jgi:hypothetical protein